MHYNGDNSYLFVNGQRITRFKAKDSVSKKNAGVITLGSLTPAYCSGIVGRLLSKNINDIIYDFSVDYSDISNEEILKIHKYLMKKNGII